MIHNDNNRVDGINLTIGLIPPPIDNQSHAYYGIRTLNKEQTNIQFLRSRAYASCVGLAAYNAETNTGMLVHFWAGGNNIEETFREDLDRVLQQWGQQPNDVYTFWDGSNPTQGTTVPRMNILRDAFGLGSEHHFHGGDGKLNLNNGDVEDIF